VLPPPVPDLRNMVSQFNSLCTARTMNVICYQNTPYVNRQSCAPPLQDHAAVRKCGLSPCKRARQYGYLAHKARNNKARCRPVRYRPASGSHRGLMCLTPRAVTPERQGRMRQSKSCLSNMKHTTSFVRVKHSVQVFCSPVVGAVHCAAAGVSCITK
jgi:hypothetical protein